MANAAKVIRIELRVGGGRGSSSKSSSNKNKKTNDTKETLFGRKQQLAASGTITLVSQLLSKGISIGETLSYNSEEKTNMMLLDMQKKAVSTALISGGALLGGPIGAAIGMVMNQFVVNPIAKGGEINIRRNLDQTRSTNRFYLTDFSGKGNYTFDYTTGSYINEDLDKVRKGSFYKKGSAI